MTTQEHAGAVALREYREQCVCGLPIHQLAFSFGGQTIVRMNYTQGFRVLADGCGAHWLLELVMSHQPAIERQARRLNRFGVSHEFQVWRITRPKPDDTDRLCIQAWSDTPDQPDSEDGPGSVKFIEQIVPYSDLPLEELETTGRYRDPQGGGFQFWVEHGTILFPEER